jgi:predicted nucleic acid-binding Zn finger protein
VGEVAKSKKLKITQQTRMRFIQRAVIVLMSKSIFIRVGSAAAFVSITKFCGEIIDCYRHEFVDGVRHRTRVCCLHVFAVKVAQSCRCRYYTLHAVYVCGVCLYVV